MPTPYDILLAVLIPTAAALTAYAITLSILN